MLAQTIDELVQTVSGVTRVKGQPGQLTSKQPSRRRAEHSWVGGEPPTEIHHRSFSWFSYLNWCISTHIISEIPWLIYILF